MASTHEKGRDDEDPALLKFVWHFICRGGVFGGHIRSANQYPSEDAAADLQLRQVSCVRRDVRGNRSQSPYTCLLVRLLLA